ncbi:MAG: DUF2089 domain-containing protein [Bacillota bacterium]
MAEQVPVLGNCPVCRSRLEVARLRCPRCGTALEGRFELCSFCALTSEQRQFAELFIVARGNLREMERMLGLSYPAIRARLESIIEALGHRLDRGVPDMAEREATAGATASTAPGSRPVPGGPVPAAERRAILEALERGEISPEQAVERLRGHGSARRE